MPHQIAVTVRADIAPGRLASVEAELQSMRDAGATDTRLPFRELTGVHFARLFVLPEVVDLRGALIPASLVYMSDVDAPLRRHLRELAARPGLDEVFGACTDYPTGAAGGREQWLRRHLIDPGAIYVHTVGRSRDQVRDEAGLRESLEQFLDTARADGSISADETAGAIHRRARDHVRSRPILRWATGAPDRPSLLFRLREFGHLVTVPLVLLLTAPILIPAASVGVIMLRLRERRDVAESGPLDLDRVRAAERFEERAAQNPFTGVGFIKAGRVRATAMRAGLWLLDYANRHAFTRTTLGGVRTIHFARWVPIDGGRRLIFASSYDGSLESYQDDFIERLWWGINPIFSNGLGFPATRWLFFGGCRDERTFKDYERRHLVPTTVWYSAYDTLSARNADDNSVLRNGLSTELTGDRATAWLAHL